MGECRRIAIVGSRNWRDIPSIDKFVEGLPKGTVVVSGGARGVDRIAEIAASRHGLETSIHLPDWDLHGKAAGFIRNRQIVDDADEVVAFWDGGSRGTKSTIDLAKKQGKPVRVFYDSRTVRQGDGSRP